MSQVDDEPEVPPPPSATSTSGRARRTKGAATGKAVVDLTGVRPVQRALFRAHQLFLGDPDATLDDVWRHGRVDLNDTRSALVCDLVSWDNLARHAKAENWKGEKDVFWDGVQRRVLALAQNRVVQQQAEELARLEGLERRLFEATVTTPARSLEGLVGAITRIDGLKGAKRDAIARRLAGEGGGQRSRNPEGRGDAREPTSSAAAGTSGPVISGPVETGLSPAEAEKLARALAAERAGVTIEPEGNDGGGAG